MAFSPDEIDDFLATFEVPDDATRLKLLQVARHQMEFAIAKGEALVAIEIRQRRSQFMDPAAALEYLNGEIRSLENKINTASKGPARNFVSFRKR